MRSDRRPFGAQTRASLLALGLVLASATAWGQSDAQVAGDARAATDPPTTAPAIATPSPRRAESIDSQPNNLTLRVVLPVDGPSSVINRWALPETIARHGVSLALINYQSTATQIEWVDVDLVNPGSEERLLGSFSRQRQSSPRQTSSTALDVSVGSATIAPGRREIVSIDLRSDVHVDPSRFIGTVTIKLAGREDPVVVPMAILVRRGPWLFFLLLILGTVCGKLFRHRHIMPTGVGVLSVTPSDASPGAPPANTASPATVGAATFLPGKGEWVSRILRLVPLAIALLLTFYKLYVTNGETLGSDGFADYLAMFVAGITAGYAEDAFKEAPR